MRIEVKDLCKSYDNDKPVLKNINLSLDNGMTGLLGANGAGKTTLIRILATVSEKNSGSIFYNGKEIEKKNELRKIIGYIPQDFSFYPDMKVYEIMDYFCAMAKIKKDRKKHIDRLLEMVNLSEEKGKKTKQLSGGMRQRLGIAVALVGNPELLLVDEPTVGLDPVERMRFCNVLAEFSKTKMVLLSTHIVEDIEATCNNLAVMDNGNIIFCGMVHEMVKQAEGRIWSAILSGKTQEEVEKNYIITSKMVTPDGTKIKIIADESPVDGAVQAAPSLQDAYVYLTIKNRK